MIAYRFFSLLLLLVVVVVDGDATANTDDFASTVTVETTVGQFVGKTNGVVDSFLGIQFAKVGKRFSRATLIEAQTTSPASSSSTINKASTSHPTIIPATSFGPYCWQAVPPGTTDDDHGFAFYKQQPQDEECLYLNIWRPSSVTVAQRNSTTLLLPTMVYIHGGGFNFGSAAEPVYNGGSHLATADYNVVVVSTNYRLGLFGFLVTDEKGKGGLNGLRDQILALEWVHSHIADFGGNPNDVTLFGESAGSMSACMLCVSPLASGLFQKAILQSGECAVGLSRPNTPQVGARNTQTILALANASSLEALANATLYPAEVIAPLSTASLIGWHTVDGWVLPKQPIELYTSNDNDGSSTSNIVPTDVIVGSNSYDSPFLLSSSSTTFMAMAMNMEMEVYSLFGPDHGAAILEAYAPEAYEDISSDYPEVPAYSQFWGDLYFRCASREFASLVSNQLKGNAFLYNYAYLSSVDQIVLNGLKNLAGITDPTWASHAADVPMVFGTFDIMAELWLGNASSSALLDLPTFEDDASVSEEMMARWISFVKTNDPNTAKYTEQWTPVPKGDRTNEAMTSATIISTFSIQSSGGRMSAVDDAKIDQCTVLLGAVSPLFSERDESATSGGSSDGSRCTWYHAGTSRSDLASCWTKRFALLLWLLPVFNS